MSELPCSNNVNGINSNASPMSVEKTDTVHGSLVKPFQTAAHVTLEKFMSKIKFSLFKQKFPELYKHDPAFMKNICLQLKSQLQVKIEDDLENCFAEQRLFQKLEELDNLIKEADKKDEISWRPSHDPNEDIRDHRCLEKMKHKMSLEIAFKALNTKIQQLEYKAEENHEEILKMKEELHEINQQINKTLEILTTSSIPKKDELHFVAEENC